MKIFAISLTQTIHGSLFLMPVEWTHLTSSKKNIGKKVGCLPQRCSHGRSEIHRYHPPPGKKRTARPKRTFKWYLQENQILQNHIILIFVFIHFFKCLNFCWRWVVQFLVSNFCGLELERLRIIQQYSTCTTVIWKKWRRFTSLWKGAVFTYWCGEWVNKRI